MPGNSLNSQLFKHLGTSFLMLRALIILILDVLQTSNSNEGKLPTLVDFLFQFCFLVRHREHTLCISTSLWPDDLDVVWGLGPHERIRTSLWPGD